jgi:hypothetical protein
MSFLKVRMSQYTKLRKLQFYMKQKGAKMSFLKSENVLGANKVFSAA